jgi:hypothetical protein
MRLFHFANYRRLMPTRAGWAEMAAIAVIVLALWCVVWGWDFSTMISSDDITGGLINRILPSSAL